MLGFTAALSHQTALLLVVAVVPTLHIVRAGIDENMAFLLLSFGIVLSEDRMEVVRIVTFYTWLLEGPTVWWQFRPHQKMLTFISYSVLPVCYHLGLFGQPHHAHEVHDSSQVRSRSPLGGRPR